MTLTLISVHITEIQEKILRDLVTLGYYANRSEAIRFYINNVFKLYLNLIKETNYIKKRIKKNKNNDTSED